MLKDKSSLELTLRFERYNNGSILPLTDVLGFLNAINIYMYNWPLCNNLL